MGCRSRVGSSGNKAKAVRGISREDLYPGLRVTNYKGSAVIAYVVGDDSVNIAGVFYGGQGFESIFKDDDASESDS